MKALTATEMREVDRLTTERYGIPSLQMMEAAGKNVADAILRDFSPAVPRRVTVLCGKGNNGGDGFVAARHLRAAGISLRLGLCRALPQLRCQAGEHRAPYLEARNTIISTQAATLR